MPRPRWLLHLQAQFWRVLMGIGMLLHRMAPPRPPEPSFTRTIPSTISGKPGGIGLMFYVPFTYEAQRRLWHGRGEAGGGPAKQPKTGSMARLTRRSSSGKRWGGYPVVINFHGGGFTLGTATDDARWCDTVVNECGAVVVSVDYRLAPECPFPTAVEDGVDAVLWVHTHADELGIDQDKIALSGFSSGGNMAFTVPLRLYDEMTDFPRDNDEPTQRKPAPPRQLQRAVLPSNSDSAPSESAKALSNPEDVTGLDVKEPAPPVPGQPRKSHTTATASALRDMNVNIRCIVPWYPSTDYTRTREQRRATTVRKDQELPALFTNLFDESYLHPPNTISLDSPYLSPGVAPTALLKNALPQDIILHCCEWDMLLDEGEAFRDRLIAPEIGKSVFYKLIEGVPHGWDKAPNPLKPTPGVREHYLRACKELRRIFGAQPGIVERPTDLGPSAARRESVPVVR